MLTTVDFAALDVANLLLAERRIYQHFELQIYAGQAKHVVEMIKAYPNQRMILVHAGTLTARSQDAINEWRAALTAMASFLNCT